MSDKIQGEDELDVTEGLLFEAQLDEEVEEENLEQPEGGEQKPVNELDGEDAGGEDVEGAEDSQTGKQPYTPEELAELLQNEDFVVDTDRLSPEGMAIWKSFNKGIQPKLEERNRLLKEREQFQQTQTPPRQERQAPPANLDEAFMRNPLDVLNRINNALIQARSVDPYSQDVIELMNLKDRYTVQYQNIQAHQAQESALYNQVYEDIYRSIPEYEKELDALNDVAYKLGFDDEALGWLTDPKNTGKYAAVLAKAAYKILSTQRKAEAARKTVNSKVNKKAPETEKAGSGFKQDQQGDEKWTDDDYFAERFNRELH